MADRADLPDCLGLLPGSQDLMAPWMQAVDAGGGCGSGPHKGGLPCWGAVQGSELNSPREDPLRRPTKREVPAVPMSGISQYVEVGAVTKEWAVCARRGKRAGALAPSTLLLRPLRSVLLLVWAARPSSNSLVSLMRITNSRSRRLEPSHRHLS